MAASKAGPERCAALVSDDAKERLSAAFGYHLLSREKRGALFLAIMRMHRGWPEMDSYPGFLRRGSFVPAQLQIHVESALLDLLNEMEQGGYDDPQ